MSNIEVADGLRSLRAEIEHKLYMTLDQSLALDRAILHFDALDANDMLDAEQED